jgi:hypothetical protein
VKQNGGWPSAEPRADGGVEKFFPEVMSREGREGREGGKGEKGFFLRLFFRGLRGFRATRFGRVR